MALKVTGFATIGLPFKVVTETTSTNTMNTNVTGTSGKVYSLDLDVGQSSSTSYFKLYLGTGAVVSGVEDIKIRLRTGAPGVKRFTMPNGIDFTEFSFFTTSTHATSNSPAVPQATAIHSFTTS
jgi:hypothetical protein